MEEELLTIATSCDDNPGCVFSGEDMSIKIIISNRSTRSVGFPIAYLERMGPYVKLIDALTNDSSRLRVGLAQRRLRDEFTTIPPLGAIETTTTITAGEIKTFRSEMIDLKVELVISADVKIDGTRIEKYRGVSYFDIVGKDTLEARN